MRSPFYRLSAACSYDRCEDFRKIFYRDKKNLTYRSTSGRMEPITHIACGKCKCWSKIEHVEEK